MGRKTYLRLVDEDARLRAERARERKWGAPYDPKKMVVRMPLGCALFIVGSIAAVIWMFWWAFQS